MKQFLMNKIFYYLQPKNGLDLHIRLVQCTLLKEKKMHYSFWTKMGNYGHSEMPAKSAPVHEKFLVS